MCDAALVVLAAFACLVGVILWLDNAQGGLTGNGVFKSMQLKPWVVDPATAKLDQSNYLFFPFYGVLCRALDALGIWTGDPRRQMTILNALFGALSAGIYCLLLHRLTGRRDVSVLAALFHLCCAFVLFLAVVNEDIMSSYTLLLASMALAAIWFVQPTASRVASVAVLFTIAWLFEWRMLFPTLPAMLAALWLCERRPVWRVGWIALFLGVLFATVCVVSFAWTGHPGAVGPFQLLYTGKGVDSVWSGFTWAKVWYLWEGIASYLLGTGIGHIPVIGWDVWRIGASLAVAVIAIVSMRMMWRQRHSGDVRALAAVFGGTWIAGEVFNLYSQPNDPQMQLTVMQWLPIGWTLAVIAASQRWPARGLRTLVAATVALAIYNVASLAPVRGLDGKWDGAIRTIDRNVDPARTVFLLHGSDWTMIYLALYWGQRDDGMEQLGPAPQDKPKMKWVSFFGSVYRTPRLSPQEHGAAFRRQIDRAFELGYTVIVTDIWNWPQSEFEKTAGTIADKATVTELFRTLHSYEVEPAFTDSFTGQYFRLRRPAR